MNQETQALIIESYESLEDEFLSFLKIVPFDEQNKNTWSSKLVNLLLDCGSQIDSVFRAIAPTTITQNGRTVTRNGMDMDNFRNLFADHFGLKNLRSLVFLLPSFTILPFNEWDAAPPQNPLWWKAYNDVKHDRLQNAGRATTEVIMKALCGLFEIIAMCPQLSDAVVRKEWLSFGGYNYDILQPLISADESITNRIAHLRSGGVYQTLVVETKLFATTIGPNPFNEDPAQIRPINYLDPHRLMAFLGRGYA